MAPSGHRKGQIDRGKVEESGTRAYFHAVEGPVTFIIGFLLTLVVSAQIFPNSTPGRWLARLRVGRWRRVIPVTIVFLGVSLLLLAAPELLPLAVGLDVSLIADILIVATAVVVQLNLRRVRYYVRRGAVIAGRSLRAIRRRRAARAEGFKVKSVRSRGTTKEL